MIITEKKARKSILKRNEDLPGGKRWSRLDFTLWLLTVLCVALSIRAVIGEPVRVKGRSMEKTLIEKDYMLLEKLSYMGGNMQRGDVIICYFPQNDEYSCVKRIIGLPGETVEIRNGTVFINGIQLNEPYLTCTPTRYHDGTWVVEEDTVFALGDNRPVSHDSSAADVGCIPMERVVGRVRCSLFPTSRAQILRHVDYDL